MNRILRIFPRRTSYTPDDDMVIINDPPGMFIPAHDEVHISCVFTWDKERCEWLKKQWEAVTDKPVYLGGPAYGRFCKDFTPGLYVKKGIVFTSRGCNNKCSFCCVHIREGKLHELIVKEGNIIADNNFLQCSLSHKDRVFEMLRTQKRIAFRGGLDCNLIDDHFIDNIKKLSIAELWLACDNDWDIPAMEDACRKLTAAGYNRNIIRCYALCMGSDIAADEQRLRAIYRAGAMPFAQLYRDMGGERQDYSHEWRKFARTWSRPAATKAHMATVGYIEEVCSICP